MKQAIEEIRKYADTAIKTFNAIQEFALPNQEASNPLLLSHLRSTLAHALDNLTLAAKHPEMDMFGREITNDNGQTLQVRPYRGVGSGAGVVPYYVDKESREVMFVFAQKWKSRADHTKGTVAELDQIGGYISPGYLKGAVRHYLTPELKDTQSALKDDYQEAILAASRAPEDPLLQAIIVEKKKAYDAFQKELPQKEKAARATLIDTLQTALGIAQTSAPDKVHALQELLDYHKAEHETKETKAFEARVLKKNYAAMLDKHGLPAMYEQSGFFQEMHEALAEEHMHLGFDFDLDQCAWREMKEETGLHLDPKRFKQLHMFSSYAVGNVPDLHTVGSYYTVALSKEEIEKLKPADDIGAILLVPASAICHAKAPGLYEALKGEVISVAHGERHVTPFTEALPLRHSLPPTLHKIAALAREEALKEACGSESRFRTPHDVLVKTRIKLASKHLKNESDIQKLFGNTPESELGPEAHLYFNGIYNAAAYFTSIQGKSDAFSLQGLKDAIGTNVRVISNENVTEVVHSQ